MMMRNQFLFEGWRCQVAALLLLAAGGIAVLHSPNVAETANPLLLGLVVASCITCELYFDSVRQDVFDELKSYDAKADKLVHQKDSFLACMSHEIRNPLQSLLGSVEMLQQTLMSSSSFSTSERASILGQPLRQLQQPQPQTTKFLGFIRDGCEVVANLVSNLMDFSHIGFDHVDIYPVPENLGESVAKSIRIVSESAKDRALEVSYIEGKDFPQCISFDPARIYQVLVNLLTNSMKFTTKGRIMVRAEWLPGPDAASLVASAVKESDWKALISPMNEIDGEGVCILKNSVPTSSFVPSYKKGRVKRVASESNLCAKLKLVPCSNTRYSSRVGCGENSIAQPDALSPKKAPGTAPTAQTTRFQRPICGELTPAGELHGVVKIEIMDTGIGIPKPARTNLFEAYEQGDTTTSQYSFSLR